MGTNVSLVSACQLCPTTSEKQEAYRKRYCLSMVMAVTTRAGRPCDRACSSRLEAIRLVTNLNVSSSHICKAVSLLCVRCSTSTTTPDLRSEVVDLIVSLMRSIKYRGADLFTVLVCYNRPSGRSRISSKADTFLFSRVTTSKLDSYDGSTSRGSLLSVSGPMEGDLKLNIPFGRPPILAPRNWFLPWFEKSKP